MPNDSIAVQSSTEPLVGRARCLVIADDCPEMRFVVRAAVGDQFSEVVEVGDGRQLLWALLQLFMRARDHAPGTVVITDFCMPTYDGLAVLDAWAELGCKAQLILMTAFPSAFVQARAQELGATVLAKPFPAATLRRLIAEAVDRPGAAAQPRILA